MSESNDPVLSNSVLSNKVVPNEVAPPRESFWRLVKEALGGSHRDFTKESLGRAVILLAVPMVVEMVMESIFAIVDIFWVSKLGPDAVAAVGLTESMLTIVYAAAMGLSMGAAAVVARRTGEGDKEGAARAAVQAIVAGVVIAGLVGLLGATFGPRLLVVMGASPATIEVGGNYTRVMLGGSVTVFLLFVINAIFRGVGDATVAMRTLMLANGINIVLAPFLVFGIGPFPKWGVTGAAVATTIGRGIGVLYQLSQLLKGSRRLQVKRIHLRIEAVTLRTILRISRSGMFQMLIGTASWVALVRLLSGYGAEVLAGYTIAVRIVLFALLPSWGMANAATTLVGQNLGAGRPDRAEAAVWKASLYNLVFLGTIGLVFVLLARPIVGLFAVEANVINHGAQALRIVSLGFLFYAYGMVVPQAFNGAGDTRTPTWLNFFCFWLWEIPLAYLLSRPLGLGPTGVFTSITVAFCTMTVVSVLVFRRGKWKTVKV
ncbi:MAG TPA: MATE family efflux transporter [Polyangia bacterium]